MAEEQDTKTAAGKVDDEPKDGKKTVEAWAIEKKLVRRTRFVSRGIETNIFREELDPIYAAARAFHAWPIGVRLTEDEFDEAIAKVGGLKMGGHRRETIREGDARLADEAKEAAEAAKKVAATEAAKKGGAS